MSKYVLLLLIFISFKLYAQTYQISFAAEGASSAIDSVIVENLNQNKSITIKGNDILFLNGNAEINEIFKTNRNSVSINPNPITDYAFVQFETSTVGNVSLDVNDITGKVIIQIQQSLNPGSHIYKLSGLSKGIYFLKVLVGNCSYSSKLLCCNLAPANPKIKYIQNFQIDNKDKITQLSNASNHISLLKDNSLINMPYNSGDILKFTGFTNIFRTVFMLVPSQNQTVTFNFVPCTDADNNNYSIVKIASQIWMAENLNVGTLLSSENPQSDNGKIEKYCRMNDESLCKSLGALYQWDEMMQYVTYEKTKGICPLGWHIPSHDEWTTLERALCTNGTCDTDFPFDITTLGWRGNDEGEQLKERGSVHWENPNLATNISGFTALPVGYKDFKEPLIVFYGYSAIFWTSTQYDINYSWLRNLYYQYQNIRRDYVYKTYGFSVRCLKNN